MVAAIKMVGSMGRPRTKPRDLTDPRGQLGAFVESWIDRHHDGDKQRLADAMGVKLNTVQKWCAGDSGPDLATLAILANHLGFDDWSKLAVAAVRHSAKQK